MAADTNPSKSQGISATEAKDLTVGGVQMTESQRVVANTIGDQAVQDSAGPKATKSMFVAAIGESKLDPTAVDHVYHTHKGVFQSNVIPPEQVATQAHYYLIGGNSFAAGGAIGAVKDNPTWSVGRVAAHVEISDGSDAYYDSFADEADAIIEAYGGIGDFSESNSSDTVALSYTFTRGTPDQPNENSWDAGQRLTGEVDGWVLFAVSNRFYYFSEQRLIRQQPIQTIDRADDEIVISLRGTVDNTGNATEATLELICDPFAFHAGEVIKLINAGPFSTGRYKGRWIIAETSRSVFQVTTTLTLKEPAPKGIEPAHDTKNAPASTADTSTAGSGLYSDPFKGATVSPSRVDQGVDYVIQGPICAIGDAKIVAQLTYSGFGTYLVYQLENGEFQGAYVYMSEAMTPTVKAGQRVKAGDKIADGHGAIESGWAQPGPTYLPMAKITGGYTEGQRTAAGDHFNELMVSLGVVRGTTSGRPTVGKFTTPIASNG